MNNGSGQDFQTQAERNSPPIHARILLGDRHQESFWKKEDPVNYENSISTAKRFDVIFTSDKPFNPQYKQDCGHEEIYQMPFACQARHS